MNIFIESLFPRWTSNQTLFPQKMKPVVANCAVLKFPIHLSNRKMFEHKKNDLLPRYLFIRRVIRYFIYSLFMIGFALLIGISGYHLFADLDWINSFYNASMILTGMGPVAEMSSIGAKLFSSFYALFSGIAFLSTTAVFFAPIAHRILHTFHIENNEQE
jgi:hypothetical protein